MKHCEYCDKEIEDNAAVCPFCRRTQEGMSIMSEKEPINQVPLDPAQEIGSIQKDISEIEVKLSNAHEKMNSTKGNRTAGYVVIFLALIGFLFLSGIWPLWLFLLVVAALTYFTASSKSSEAKSLIIPLEQKLAALKASLEQKLAALKASLAEKQAAIAIAPKTEPTSNDPVQKVKQLKEMQDSGLITSEEFEAKKAEILSRI